MEQILFFGALFVSCLTAGILGGGPERIAAALLAIAGVISTLIAGSEASIFSQIEWGLFLVDSVLALFLVLLALATDRYWPMWLSALQIVSALMHPAFGLSVQKLPFAYAIATIIWSYPMMMILMIGTVRYRARESRNHAL